MHGARRGFQSQAQAAVAATRTPPQQFRRPWLGAPVAVQTAGLRTALWWSWAPDCPRAQPCSGTSGRRQQERVYNLLAAQARRALTKARQASFAFCK